MLDRCPATVQNPCVSGRALRRDRAWRKPKCGVGSRCGQPRVAVNRPTALVTSRVGRQQRTAQFRQRILLHKRVQESCVSTSRGINLDCAGKVVCMWASNAPLNKQAEEVWLEAIHSGPWGLWGRAEVGLCKSRLWTFCSFSVERFVAVGGDQTPIGERKVRTVHMGSSQADGVSVIALACVEARLRRVEGATPNPRSMRRPSWFKPMLMRVSGGWHAPLNANSCCTFESTEKGQGFRFRSSSKVKGKFVDLRSTDE